MQDAKKALQAARRAIAIANSKEFDDDVVRRVLDNAQNELEEAGLEGENVALPDPLSKAA